MKLNLGCGIKKIKGFVNCDVSEQVNPDKVVNLNEKLPFKDNSVDEVLMIHVLEHLDNPIFSLNEVYRVCKDDAKVRIATPHFLAR